MQTPDAVLIHYAELGLKGRSRPFFEREFRSRVNRALRHLGTGRARLEPGRVTVWLEEADAAAVATALRRLPGVAWFAMMHRWPWDVEFFKRAAVEQTAGDSGTFRVSVKRADRRFPVTSMEVARQIGAAIVLATGRRVDLKRFDHNYCLEIGEQGAYFYAHREPGLGGLPSGVNGTALVLLSGGVDSATAAARMMCRGVTVEALHVHHAALAAERAADRPDRMAAALSHLQGELTLHRVDFREIHEAVHHAVAPDLRAVVHRRMMLRLAERLRQDRGLHVVVTGDVVGQVAAQTVENLYAGLAAVPAPVLTPVAGANRDEVLRTAERLDIIAIAALPYEDCVHQGASVNPGHFTTPEDFAAAEVAFEDLDGLITGALETLTTVHFRFGESVLATGEPSHA